MTPQVRRRAGRGNIYAAGRKLLDSDALGASIAGTAGEKPTGLNRLYDDRLSGKRSSTLRFGDRVIARVKGTQGQVDHDDDPPRAAAQPPTPRWATRSAAWP